MILTYRNMFSKIITEESKVDVLVVENPKLFAAMVSDLYRQKENEDGGFTLATDDYKPLKISKKLEFIQNPAVISLNDKHFINRLYIQLKENSNDEDNYRRKAELFSEVAVFVQGLCEISEFDIDFDNDFEMSSLFKSVGVRFYENNNSLEEKILDYILTVRDLFNIDIFVILNLKSYIDIEMLNYFEKSIIDHKISLVLLESTDRISTEYEKKIIIDGDLCEI